MKINFRILILTFCILLSLGGCGKESETTAPTAPTIVGTYYQSTTATNTYLAVQITQTNENYYLTLCMFNTQPDLDKGAQACYTEPSIKNLPLTKYTETSYSFTQEDGGKINTITLAAAADFSSITGTDSPDDPEPKTFTRLTDKQANNVVLTAM